jgi:hypothetical protein
MASFNEPPPDAPLSPDAPLLPDPNDPNAYDLAGAKRRSRPIIVLVIGVLILGLAGFGVYRMIASHKEAKVNAQFMEQFAAVEKDELAPFWACVFGMNIDPGMFADTKALGGRVEGMFAGDPLNYPDKLVEDCVPKLEKATSRAKALDPLPDYAEALAAYQKSLPPLGEGLTSFAESAKKRGPERELAKKVQNAITAFHSAEGAPPPEAIGYERFLRCAVPDLDKLKDGQALVERLFESCKKPEFMENVRATCGRHITGAVETKVDAKYKASLKRFGPDDRDASAWEDCFKKARKGQKQDDLEPFGKAWVAYMDAGGKVRKIGAAKLKDDQ